MMSDQFVFTISAKTTQTIHVREPGQYVINLVGEGANAVITAATAVQKNDHTSYQVVVHHQAPHTSAQTKLLGIVHTNGFLQLKAKIIIDENCHDCQSFLTERVLLLSPTARAEVIPDLEILNNEVRCSHAASISRIPESQIFYLLSRGISRQKAESMIAQGFLLQ